MKPSLLLAAALLGVGGLAMVEIAPGGASHEAVLKDILGTVEELTKILKTVKDRDGAEVARPALKKAAEKLLDLRKKAQEGKQPNKEERDRLEKEYAPKMKVAFDRFQEAVSRVRGIPGGEDAIAELEILKDKNGKDKDKEKKNGK